MSLLQERPQDRLQDRLEERVSALFGIVRRNKRPLTTPEGVVLPIDIADATARLAAFIIDVVIWFGATLFFYVVMALLLVQGVASEIAITLNLFIAFLVRNLYFIGFEQAWRGATPGKRMVRLRVIDRRGGPLGSSAVVARNLTREVEIFLPLGLLLTGTGSGSFASLVLGIWLLLFTALPLFNRDRMRAGDFLAGTIVILAPQQRLLDDLVETRTRFAFTQDQLGVYGAFELQVLEEMLRRDRNAETVRLLAQVSGKIIKKIDWREPLAPDAVVEFLSEFYTAERAFLEREKLFGRARLDKNEAAA